MAPTDVNCCLFRHNNNVFLFVPGFLFIYLFFFLSSLHFQSDNFCPSRLVFLFSLLFHWMNCLLQKYRILGKKGEGTFSEVLKCQKLTDGTFWACKKMKQTYGSHEQVNKLREIQAMRRLNPHPNILDLQEVIFDKRSGMLVLICELMDMNIYELIKDKRTYLPEETVKNYMYQLCKSVDHIHRLGIFHRDVKPENVLVKIEENLLKLADFGSCRSLNSRPPYTEYISTRWYRAPECLLTEGYYSHKMDIWSIGCVFFEILSLHPLFPGANEVDQITKIHDVIGTPDGRILSKIMKSSRGINYNFPPKRGTGIEKLVPHASQEAVSLMQCLCTYDPDVRMTARQALKHPFFREYWESEDEIKMEKQSKTSEDLSVVCHGQEMNMLPKIMDKSKKDPETKFSVIRNLPKAQSLPTHLRHHKEKRKRKHKKTQENPDFVTHTGLLPRLNVHSTSVGPLSRIYPNAFNSNAKFNPSGSLTLLPNLPQVNQFQKPSKPSRKNLYRHYQLAPLLNQGGHTGT